MRKGLRRWLFHRRAPKMRPLYQRTGWQDFCLRMRRAIDIDIRMDLGELNRDEWILKQTTKPLPAYDAPTVATWERQWWRETTQPDPHGTQPLPLAELLR